MKMATIKRWIRDCWPLVLVLMLGIGFRSDLALKLRVWANPALDALGGGIGQSLSVYLPSDIRIVDQIVEELQLRPDDVLVDIGSGDGRYVIRAAQEGARGIGIDRLGELITLSRDKARATLTQDRTTFIHADALTVPDVIRQATVVILFLTDAGLTVLTPELEKLLQPGTRVVANTFIVPGWRPEKVVVSDDTEELRAIYYYRVPATDPYAMSVHRD